MIDERKPAQVLEEEHHRSTARRRLLERAVDRIREGMTAHAVKDLICAVEMLNDSEDRVMRLHAECYAMIQETRKVLALDASLRPVVIRIAPTEQSGEESR